MDQAISTIYKQAAERLDTERKSFMLAAVDMESKKRSVSNDIEKKYQENFTDFKEWQQHEYDKIGAVVRMEDRLDGKVPTCTDEEYRQVKDYTCKVGNKILEEYRFANSKLKESCSKKWHKMLSLYWKQKESIIAAAQDETRAEIAKTGMIGQCLENKVNEYSTFYNSLFAERYETLKTPQFGIPENEYNTFLNML